MTLGQCEWVKAHTEWGILPEPEMRPPAGQMTPLSMRQYSRNLQPPAVHLMHEPRRLEKHQWAGSVHHVDPVLATKSNGIRRNRTGPAGPFVKPDPAHSRCDRVLYQTDGGAWRSNDEEALHRFREIHQAGEAGHPVKLLKCWVQRDHVVSSLLQLTKQDVAELVRITRNSCYRDPALSQKVVNDTSVSHGFPPRSMC